MIKVLVKYIINILQHNGLINSIFFNDENKIGQLGFTYFQKDEPLETAINLSSKLNVYPPEDLLIVDYLTLEFSPETIKEALLKLKLETLNIYFRHKMVKDPENLIVEAYYGTKYRKRKLTDVINLKLISVEDMVKKYGADSLRYYLTTSSAPGLDLRFDEEKLSATWNFINKIWNASRYTLMNIEDIKEIDFNNLTFSDKWILTRFNDTVKQVRKNMDKYELPEGLAVVKDKHSTYRYWAEDQE